MRFPAELDAQYSRIFIGAGWPAKLPGFVVVVGERGRDRVGGRPVLEVLDEAEDGRLWHIVDHLWALRTYYRPERVLADCGHHAAMRFTAEQADLVLEHSFLVALDGPLAYALPALRRLHDPQAEELSRLRIPPAGRLRGWLATPPASEDPATLRLSDYPAVAALAYAVLGLETSRQDSARPMQDQVQ